MELFTVKHEYIERLKLIDKRVCSNKDSKNVRPYIGIVIAINSLQYFAPLSSYKINKHKTNSVTVIIEIDSKTGLVATGAIQINNMIPVPSHFLIKIDANKVAVSDRKYATLLSKQIKRINKEPILSEIITKANYTYNMVINGKKFKYSNICINFNLLEKYILMNEVK